MNVNPWKTKLELFHEKKDPNHVTVKNERMQRGLDLEPIARDLFYAKTGHVMIPTIIVKEWAMASLDGINAWNEILEIKCPGEKDHAIALQGKVPDHYYPQLQHQMYVCDANKVYYFSYDGIDGVIVEVKRNDEYIEKLLIEEHKFYECLINNIPPEPEQEAYIERNDEISIQCTEKWKQVSQSLKELEKEEEELRKQMIFLSGETNTKCNGVTLCQVKRKGAIEYSKIPQLKGIDLESFRKEAITSWRITCSQ